MPEIAKTNRSATGSGGPGHLSMSVVIYTPDDFLTIRKTMSHLCGQTARSGLEIVIVKPSNRPLNPDVSMTEVFGKVTIVETTESVSVGKANAAGIRAATAPVIALAEDHCFPDPDWAEELINAHRGPWAVVGPSVRSANPRTAISRADFLIGYGPWAVPVQSGEMDFLPGHNSSYKREILLKYGDRLEEMMDAETLLHWDLRRNGRRLYLHAPARVAHTNFSLWRSWIPVQFNSGRLFAGLRMAEMTGTRRLLYVAGAPLIPFVRLWRVLPRFRGATRHYAWSLPALMVGLIVDGAGQMAGYMLGPGKSSGRLAECENRRIDHVCASDRALFAEEYRPPTESKESASVDAQN